MASLTTNLAKAVGAFSGMLPFNPINGLRRLPAGRWDPVSVDGQHVGKVTQHDLGLELPSGAWATWQWAPNEDVGTTSLRIWASPSSKDVAVTLGGTLVDEKGRLQVRPIVQGLSVKISVRVHFVVDGRATEYRFDGKVS